MFARDHSDRDIDDEVRAYVDLLTQEKIRQGMNPDVARRAAVLETGGIEPVKNGIRDVRRGLLLETILQDTRYALRTLLRVPAFTVAAVVTLAIGIGASTAIFSMVNGVLLRRLPIGSGDRLVHLVQPSVHSGDERFSVLEVKDLNDQLKSFAGVSEFHSMSFQLYGHGDPLRVQTGVVSDHFFDIIGVKPIMGRTFLPGEDAVGAEPVVVLSYHFWMNEMHGDPRIVGSTFTMNDKIHHVVGVLPPLPGYPNDNDLWMPAGACPFRSAPAMMNDRGMRMVFAYGVLKPGVSLEQARAELSSLGSRAHAEYANIYPAQDRLRYDLVVARDEMTQRARPIFYLLMATAAFLLLAAVANVTNLSLSRQMRRGRELALRVAIGAGRARLYRQLALESVVLTVTSGVLGILLAGAGMGLLRSLATRLTARAQEIQIDGTVLVFAIGISVLIALAIAVAPFLHLLSERNVATSLRQGNSGAGGTRIDLRMRSTLVVAQVAMAFVMLVGAGLIGRSLAYLERVDAGVDVRNVVTARLTLNFTKYDTRDKVTSVLTAVGNGIAQIPGASATAIASDLPLNGNAPSVVNFDIAASGADQPLHGRSDVTAVSPDYFHTVGIPLLRGRDFTSFDRDTASPSVIVSQRLAAAAWHGRDPIGTRISTDSGRHWLPVVGVVGNVRQNRLDGDITDEVYYPLAVSGANDVRVFLRANAPVPAIVRSLRDVIGTIDPQQPIAAIQTLEQVRGAQLAEPRLTTSLMTVFAVLALVLTATGLAGVIAYGVTQRLPEFAIRMALGASGGRVISLVMSSGLTIVLIGLAAGGVVSIAASQLVTKLLFHILPNDVPTYSAVVFVILATAFTACLIPSRRALRTDPAQVFRAG